MCCHSITLRRQVAETEWGARVTRAEEGARKAEGDAAAARARVVQVESQLKSREATIEKLTRSLDAVRWEDAEPVGVGGGFKLSLFF